MHAHMSPEHLQRLRADALRGMGCSSDDTIALVERVEQLQAAINFAQREDAGEAFLYAFARSQWLEIKLEWPGTPAAVFPRDALATCPMCQRSYYTGTSHANCIAAIGMCGVCGMKEGAE